MTTSPLTGAPNTKWVAIFDQYAAIIISKTVIDSDMFTIEDEYKVVCALLNRATFDEPE